MGRRDAVAVVLEVVARMRALEPRLAVEYAPGWERRGNGLSANYEGGIVHHTALLSSLSDPFPARNTLIDGRPDLSGPLCNFGGPACTPEAPKIVVVAAHPANHAGASGGRSMGPLPRTSLFNPRVLGLEIDYAGLRPMLPGQLYVAKLWARAVADVVGGGNIEVVRAHFETSVTGKWDPGYAPGRSIDMAEFRAGAWNITTLGDDMPLTAQDEAQIEKYGGLIEAAAVRAAAHVATAKNAWGLDNLRRRMESLAAQIAAADANDSPEALAAVLAPLLLPAVLEALAEQGAVPALGSAQLEAAAEAALRRVLGSLDEAVTH